MAKRAVAGLIEAGSMVVATMIVTIFYFIYGSTINFCVGIEEFKEVRFRIRSSLRPLVCRQRVLMRQTVKIQGAEPSEPYIDLYVKATTGRVGFSSRSKSIILTV